MGRFRRQRKPLAAVVMACWLFALFVSVVHACGFDADQSDTARAAAMTMSGNGEKTENAPPGCNQFCADDIPVLSKIKAVQDQSSAQALLVSSLSVAPALPGNSFAVTPLHNAQPPTGVSLNIRFVRLVL